MPAASTHNHSSLALLLALSSVALAPEKAFAQPAPTPDAAPSAAPAPPPSPAEPAPPTPPPVTSPSPAAAPPTKPAPIPAPPPPPLPPPEEAGRARVHLAVDYPHGWLELRSHVDATDWTRVCDAPCDTVLHVDGMEARVLAPGMTTSNVFRLEAGRGTARFRVNGGSSRARSIGLGLMIGGIPVSLGGFGMLGYGHFRDNDGFKLAGAVTLGVGALSILVSLPLLISGSTTVKDAKGDTIAWRSEGPFYF